MWWMHVALGQNAPDFGHINEMNEGCTEILFNIELKQILVWKRLQGSSQEYWETWRDMIRQTFLGPKKMNLTFPEFKSRKLQVI